MLYILKKTSLQHQRLPEPILSKNTIYIKYKIKVYHNSSTLGIVFISWYFRLLPKQFSEIVLLCL